MDPWNAAPPRRGELRWLGLALIILLALGVLACATVGFLILGHHPRM
ncbi:MAG TPA: hypothetical protein VF808_10585 [Ktedonobacterales bacterium]